MLLTNFHSIKYFDTNKLQEDWINQTHHLGEDIKLSFNKVFFK